jgi:hypothetical protein
MKGWMLAGAVLLSGLGTSGPVSAQPFDHMKCYKIRDSQDAKLYTADLVPKLTHDFQTELGDRYVGGLLQKGCRIKVPAKLFCIDVDKQNAKDAKPPYDPAQWTVDGPESGERLCYKLVCPPVLPKELAIIDQFGTRSIQLLGRTDYLCTPVNRQNPSTDPCEMAADGQCGGVCGEGERCLATSPSDCQCRPESEMCAGAPICSEAFCGGVWETCVSLPGGGCGCSHP